MNVWERKLFVARSVLPVQGRSVSPDLALSASVAASANLFPLSSDGIGFEGGRQGEVRFFHPLGARGGEAALAVQGLLPTGGEWSTEALEFPGDWDEVQTSRARFFCHWRLAASRASRADYRFALCPADPRLPDFTCWSHSQVASAIEGCVDETGRVSPAFLKFQIGPVQEFIAQARSTRDLWSGSYLLSWLMAVGLKTVAEGAGPDAVIFPNLRNQPLVDLQFRETLWKRVRGTSGSLWDEIVARYETDGLDFLTPNLPNVFLALVPAARAEEIAQAVEAAIRKEWRNIAKASWQFCTEGGLTASEAGISQEERLRRFEDQTEKFLSFGWNITPWPDNIAEILGKANALPDAGRLRELKIAEVGHAWSLLSDICAWELDGIRQTRAFAAWASGGWSTGVFNNKDCLSGKDEAVAGGRVWSERAGTRGDLQALFKKDDFMGAVTLVKRTWHLAYLAREWGLPKLSMPNTRSLAAHDPFGKDDADELEPAETSESYFAVLAFDGDQIGKWVSGENAPLLDSQLAEPGREHSVAGKRRPASPGYHLHLSEALANFSLNAVRPIVETFNGRLIYAGGDDVLALLPADQAIPCAEALQLAFRGEEVASKLQEAACRLLKRHEKEQTCASLFLKKAGEGSLFDCRRYPKGFLARNDHDRFRDQTGAPIPLIIPGMNATASVGIAIGHYKAPLQDMVRAAQRAEKRAKAVHGRSAVAVTLFKRSGETVEWGTQWASGALNLYRLFAEALADETVSARFPYRLAELLTPYLSNTAFSGQGAVEVYDDFPVTEVIEQELLHVLGRQVQTTDRFKREWFTEAVQSAMRTYLSFMVERGAGTEAILLGVIGLCQTVAFSHRTSKI